MRFQLSLAASDAEIADCFPVIQQLRPQLTESDWVTRVRRMAGEGYRLLAARDAGGVIGVAGFRIFECIARGGRSLYVDDLVTDSTRRSEGTGRALLDWLVAEGRRQGCTELCLDSGVQRPDAHRFYMREKLAITAYHFARAL
jgi:GNAT superfamily N-acetyltransferase